MINTTFDHKLGIIQTTYSGKITAEEIIRYVFNLRIPQKQEKEILYFEDHTEAEFIFSPAEIKQIVHTLYAKIRNSHGIRVAVLNTRPRETAFSIIAIRLLRADNLYAKVFCTRQAALDWLLVKQKMEVEL
ncbi:MAG: hypothetical protein IPM71_03205 [Bacteroidota bacterium]|nr:MAG: hypothetical protein IPM71_03205 [Bacteroidota bacterium]